MLVMILGRLGRWVHILNHSAQVIHRTNLVNTQGYSDNALQILNLTSVCLFVFPVPPKIYDISNDMTINEGTNVTLTCLATGKPEPAISWRHISPSGECRPAALAAQRVSEPRSFPSSLMRWRL